jgi:hypothetical protein
MKLYLKKQFIMMVFIQKKPSKKMVKKKKRKVMKNKSKIRTFAMSFKIIISRSSLLRSIPLTKKSWTLTHSFAFLNNQKVNLFQRRQLN